MAVHRGAACALCMGFREWRERPPPAAQHLVGIVAAHLFQMCAEAVIVDVVLEAGLELPCLIVNSELGDVPDLGGCAAEAGLGFGLDLALITVADRPVRLPWVAPHKVPVSRSSHHHASRGGRL